MQAPGLGSINLQAPQMPQAPGLGQRLMQGLFPISPELSQGMSPEELKRARGQAMMQLGLGMLAANNRGAGFGEAALAGILGAQQGLGAQLGLRHQMRMAQEAKEKAEERQRLEDERYQAEQEFKRAQAKAEQQRFEATQEATKEYRNTQADLERSQQQLQRDIAQMQQRARDQAATQKTDTKLAELARTWNTYEQAKQGLLSGLAGTETGPIAGRLPAITSAQQTAEGAVSAMAPVLKQLFRVSGEGVFTDRDQQLLLDMVPTRKDSPEARANKIRNIDNIVRAKLGLPIETPTAADFVYVPGRGLQRGNR